MVKHFECVLPYSPNMSAGVGALKNSSHRQQPAAVPNPELEETYREALKRLAKLESTSQPAIKKLKHPRLRRAELQRFGGFLKRIGRSVDDLDKLRIIHVSGTKGKGSTGAFTESILRSHDLKTGFYSSPHLLEVRERIRINGQPLPVDSFTKYYQHVMTSLERHMEKPEDFPTFFKFLTLMAVHAFLSEGVEVAVIEVGIGGEYDCTNIVKHPWVVGITALDMDHIPLLGRTIQEIAWHKAGILKPGAAAFTISQQQEAMFVIEQRAKERQCPVTIVPPFPEDFKLGVAGRVQSSNGALATHMANAWLHRWQAANSAKLLNCLSLSNGEYTNGDKHSNGEASSSDDEGVPEESSWDPSTPYPCHWDAAHGETYPLSTGQVVAIPSGEGESLWLRKPAPIQLDPETMKGLLTCRWAGRYQTLERPPVTYFLDGAHTITSCQAAVEWFMGASATALGRDPKAAPSREGVARYLLFSYTGGRDPRLLLSPLKVCHFDAVFFCPAKLQQRQELAASVGDEACPITALVCREVWKELTSCSDDVIHTMPSIADAVHTIETLFKDSTVANGSCNGVENGDARCNGVQNGDACCNGTQNGVALNEAFPHHEPQLHVLVTGSLYLVGGILRLMNWK